MDISLAVSAKDKLLKNLSVLSESQDKLHERRISEIAELACLAAEYTLTLFSDDFDLIYALSAISESIEPLPLPVPNHSGALFANEDRILSFRKSVSVLDKVHFSQLYLERLNERAHAATEDLFLQGGSGDGRISYARNGYADEAYDVFSQELPGSRVKYVSSLKDAVREVVQDGSEFALLPIEERGSRIATVEEMLFSNELKIAAITSVFGFDGSADMKYALISKHFRMPRVREGDERYIELMLSDGEDTSLSELLVAAEALGLSLYRVCAISFTTQDGDTSQYAVILKDNGKGFSPFLTYLTLFEPSAQIVGIYKNLE